MDSDTEYFSENSFSTSEDDSSDLLDVEFEPISDE